MKLHISSQGIALWEQCGEFKKIEKHGDQRSDIDIAIWIAKSEGYVIYDNRKNEV